MSSDSDILFNLLIASIIFIFVRKRLLKWYKNHPKNKGFSTNNTEDLPTELSELRKAEKIIRKHMPQLLMVKRSSTTKDPYGKIIEKKWIDEDVRYFINEHIAPYVEMFPFSGDGSSSYKNGHRIHLYELIERKIIKMVAAKEISLNNKSPNYSPKFSGIEYESFCSQLLQNYKWKVALTKGSGDQGIDIIATKAGVSVGIQCKHFNRPVGNKAVQEVVAGVKHFNLDYGVVVAPNSFTKSANELANSNRVLLLHHSELVKLKAKKST
ncbi:MAG: restriction endonuclease [Bacteroidetes bacterium]|nr:restriction endonuclease [Bacteroidota bacterium]